jgi:hypothetical protein
MADTNSSSMETDPSKSTQELSEEIWSGLDNNAIASLYQQLGYVPLILIHGHGVDLYNNRKIYVCHGPTGGDWGPKKVASQFPYFSPSSESVLPAFG